MGTPVLSGVTENLQSRSQESPGGRLFLANLVDCLLVLWYNQFAGYYATLCSITQNDGLSAVPATERRNHTETSYTASSASPAVQLPTNRSLLKFILLSIITLGIYGLVVMTKISTEINTIAGPYDNKKTMNYCLVVLIFSWLTMGIVPLVWAHRFSNRVGSELLRRNLPYQFNAGTFWLWNVLGSLIVVGPFVYTHKLLTAMNMLCTDYNAKG